MSARVRACVRAYGRFCAHSRSACHYPLANACFLRTISPDLCFVASCRATGELRHRSEGREHQPDAGDGFAAMRLSLDLACIPLRVGCT
eukprot:5329021-Pleurochrysis_carterae.AAC.2